jgi:hypothetical protein
MSVEVLQELSADWAAIIEDVQPFGGTELLARARSLVRASWFAYELLVMACLVGFQAVEAMFRQGLFPDAKERVSFRQMADRSEREGFFGSNVADVLRAGVELRNDLSHPIRHSQPKGNFAGCMLPRRPWWVATVRGWHCLCRQPSRSSQRV